MMDIQNKTDHCITLTDGRQLGYAEYGTPNGIPVIFCHGAPGSRLSIFSNMSQAAAQRNIRLIAPDRPGYGLSTYREARSLLDWADDLRQLTASLGLQKYQLLGFSMGSLTAFACAYALPENITKMTIVGAAAPMEAEGVMEGLSPTSTELFAVARTDKIAFANIIKSMAPNAAAVFNTMAATMSPLDGMYLNAHQQAFETDFAATLASGTNGVTTDLIFAATPWGFAPEKITCHVDLWVGTEDSNTPPAMTRYMASVLPRNRVFTLANHAHCCLYTHWETILDKLME